MKVSHWENRTLTYRNKLKLTARTLFPPGRDRILWKKKRKTFLQAAKMILEKYTDGINTSGHSSILINIESLQNIFLIVSNIVECLTFYVLLRYVYLYFSVRPA